MPVRSTRETADTGRNGARRPGRPSAAAASGEQLREEIIAASGQVYAQRGYHGVTVERILKAAGVSRPTFYRYFRDRYEVLDALIGALNDQLRDLIIDAVSESETLDVLLERAVDAYFEWGERIGPLAGPLYREIHDTASPASAHRLRLLRELLALFAQQPLEHLPVTNEPLLHDAAIHLVEHLGHSTFWPELLPEVERLARREVILRALRGILLRE